MSRQRYVILAFVVGAVLVGMVARSAVGSVLEQLGRPDIRVLGLVSMSMLVAGVATVATFFGLLRTKKAVKFTDEVVGELAKVTWPTRAETVSATRTVILATLFTAALMGLYDLVWKNLADLVLFTEG